VQKPQYARPTQVTNRNLRIAIKVNQLRETNLSEGFTWALAPPLRADFESRRVSVDVFLKLALIIFLIYLDRYFFNLLEPVGRMQASR